MDELQLDAALAVDPEILLVRRLCRSLLKGEVTEREVTRWVHSAFHHQSDNELLNELALLDDDYDDMEWNATNVAAVTTRVREIAAQLLAA